MSLRVAVLVSGEGSNLQALIDTVHSEGVDSGPIIMQEAFDPVPYSRDIAAVERRVHEIEHRLLPQAVRLVAAGRVRIDPANPRRVIVEEAADGHN